MFCVLVRVSQVQNESTDNLGPFGLSTDNLKTVKNMGSPQWNHMESSWHGFCMDMSWLLFRGVWPDLVNRGARGAREGLRTHEDSSHRPKIQVKSVLFVALVSFTLGVVTLILGRPAEPGYPPKYGQIPEKTIWWSPPVFCQFSDGSTSFVRYVGGWSIH